MRKTIVTLVALCAAMTANATILRVSNVNGSTAPYSTIKAAHDAASEGDTIMVEGSENEYEKTVIEKRLVLIGPGFWLNNNGIVEEAAPSAKVQFVVQKEAPGTVIKGFSTSNRINAAFRINADNCVVTRCYITSSSYYGVQFGRENSNDPIPSGAVVHQNFFKNCNVSGWQIIMTNVQITNNIFAHYDMTVYDIQDISNSQIAYNTMICTDDESMWRNFATVNTSTIEHNILWHPEVWYSNIGIADDNEKSGNYIQNIISPDAVNTDKDVKAAEQALPEGDYGAFAGDSPYVISGIPSAPVIEDLVVPTTVEAGSKMKVTIKVGIQK